MMRKQATATLLCALLISTLAHEYLHHQHPPSQKRVAKHGAASNHLLSAQNRDGSDSDQVCGWKCPPTGSNSSTGDIKVVINVNASIIGLVNLTSNIGIAFDINANIVVLFNGTDGNVIAIDIHAQTGARVTGQVSSLLWVAANGSFEAYINGLTSLKVVLDFALKVGTKFSVSSASHEILQIVAEALVSFGLTIGKEINANFSNALQVVVQLANRITVVLKGSLAGILGLFIGTTVIVNISLIVLVEIFEGLGAVIKQISGGIATLIKLHLQLDLKIILTAASGIELLAYLFEVFIAAGIDVVGAFGGLSIDKLFSLIAELSGSASGGFSAFVHVIGLVIGVVNGSVSIDVLIEALVQLSISVGLDANVSEQLAASLKALLKVLAKLNVSGQISATIEAVEKLAAGGLVIAGVNISAIVVILAGVGTKAALDIVVGVLIGLGAAVNAVLSIPSLLLYVIAQLNTHVGLSIVVKLFPNLKISASVSASADGSILEAILKSVKISDILKAGPDVDKLLRALPVIGDIYVSLSASISTASHGSLQLKVIIKSGGAGSVIKKILKVLGAALHFDLSGSVHVGVGRAGHHQAEGKHFNKHENRHIEHLKHAVQEKVHHHQQQ